MPKQSTNDNDARVVVLLALLTNLFVFIIVSGDEFCGHSIEDNQRHKSEKYDARFSGQERRKRSTVLTPKPASDRNHHDYPKSHRAIHEFQLQANQYHEEHHIIIDDGSSLSLPAEHRAQTQQMSTETRISNSNSGNKNAGTSSGGGGGGNNCGPAHKAATDRQQQQQSSNNNNRFPAEAANQASQDDCDQKTIETAVFIDQALDNKFNGLSNGLVELNKLVLTIMNQVQHLFRYSSLKVPIRIKLVLVEHMRDSEKQGISAPNPERGDIDAYLSNFCNWQQNRLERERRIWWDHAILLSGLDLYKATPGKNHSGVLGLAWVGGMCKGNYSCTINEASNLESAFVIAHEIGHSLGIMHDGQRNNCDPNGFIMSERTGAGKVHWSRCSNSYLNDSIQKRQLTCLDSEQNSVVDPLYDLSKLRMPGQVYSINDQCKLAFGGNHTSFVKQQSPFNGVCRELWCVSGNWAKAAHPALEGSSCGDQDRVCLEGKCSKR